MRGHYGAVKKHHISGRRLFALLVRAAVIASMSFAVAFGFLSGITGSAANYNPHDFAVGIAGLFGAACGVIALLLSRMRILRTELREQDACIEELFDLNWELKESEERAKNFLESLGDVIVRRDAEGRVSYANDAYCALAGEPREALLGTLHQLPVVEQSDTAVSVDGTRTHDQKITTAEGPRWIAWREVLVRNGSAGTETQCVGRDVTDRSQSERALAEARDQSDAANLAKSRFLAMVSHEIRTPLNGILGMADLLIDTELTPEQKTYTNAVKTSGDTLLALIEEILDFSKIEAGKLDLEARPFALAPLVEEVVELIGIRAQAKGLEIAGYVDERLPERVVGDAARLRQVLFNLAGNAVKFTEKGGVSIVVGPGIWPEDVSFMVRDTGIGIAAHDQERIFREFEQADDGSTRKFAGTGLGLAISKRIVERMGGRINIDSAQGAGSTFEVALPLPPATNAPPASFTVPDLTDAEVLIVAPAPIEAELIARRLMRWGARTCIVPDDKVAAALIPERGWTAMLVDNALGPDAAQTLVAAASAIARRIMLITPSARHDLPALKEAGFTGYLIKPVRAASLAARFEPADTFERGAAASTEPDGSTHTGAASSKGLSILVAEDNEINALLARALLIKLGHNPTVATTGAEALEAWLGARSAGTPYDLVLMDVRMPEMDGIEVVRRIREVEAANPEEHTTVIALTANALSEDRQACLDTGMDGFLVKPLDRERLARALATVEAPLAA